MKELKYLFCNIGWMEYYRGVTGTDKKPESAGSGGPKREKFEVCNFLPVKENKLFGYVQPQGRGTKFIEKKMSIENIVRSKDKKQKSVEGVFVIWTALRKPGEQVVVGWYKDATVFRESQKFSSFPSQLHEESNITHYRIQADNQDARLLPIDERKIKVSNFRSVWYDLEGKGKKLAHKVWKLAQESPGAANKNSLRGFADYEHKLKVENAAIEEAKKYYEDKVRGCEVISVEKKNKGWDLEVKSNKNSSPILFVEVKGLSGSTPTVELTPNEFSAFKKKLSGYRLVVVVDALTNPTLFECYFDNDSNDWEVYNLDKEVLIEEEISAKIKISDGA